MRELAHGGIVTGLAGAGNTWRGGYIVLLFPLWKQVGGQDGAIPELFRYLVERLIESIPLFSVAVEQPQLRCHCTKVAGMHAGESDGVGLHLPQEP